MTGYVMWDIHEPVFKYVKKLFPSELAYKVTTRLEVKHHLVDDFLKDYDLMNKLCHIERDYIFTGDFDIYV